MTTPALAAFTIGGLDEEGGCTEPVWISCQGCGDGNWFTYRADDPDRTTPLAALVAWAAEHECEQGSAA